MIGCLYQILFLTGSLQCPVDVAKTRLMADGAGQKYTGMVQTIRSVYVNEGVGALYKGLWPRIARVAPGQGITFMVMELVCSHVGIDSAK